MSAEGVVWRHPNMPFLVGYNETPRNPHGVSDFLPFELFVEPKTGLVRQVFNSDVDAALTDLYERGSVIGPAMDEDSSHKSYCDDFVSFVGDHIEINGNSFLEVGSGTGYLLNQLNNAGACTLGIEPGGSYSNNWKKYNVDVIRGMFPHSGISGRRFDGVMSYAVMEHIPDYKKFLYDQIELLKDDAILFVSVPDCGPYFSSSDPSCFVHEHYSYFTVATLRKVLSDVGLVVIECRPANYGGALYAAARKTTKIKSSEFEVSSHILSSLAPDFGKMTRFDDYWSNRYESSISAGKSVGIYCPSRALNVIESSMRIRFFDDDPSVHGKYLPGFCNSIENFSDLERVPVNEIWIFSYTFGEVIRQKIIDSKRLVNIEIICVSDIDTEL